LSLNRADRSIIFKAKKPVGKVPYAKLWLTLNGGFAPSFLSFARPW
jgi:hypothetical protein